jgi:hypothetical protein
MWLIVMALLTVPVVIPLSRFERPRGGAIAPPLWRGVAGVIAVCLGLALLAYFGVGGPDGINWIALALPLAGAVVGGVVRPRQG